MEWIFWGELFDYVISQIRAHHEILQQLIITHIIVERGCLQARILRPLYIISGFSRGALFSRAQLAGEKRDFGRKVNTGCRFAGYHKKGIGKFYAD